MADGTGQALRQVLWVIAIALVIIALSEMSQTINLYSIKDSLASLAG
jgi:hypothetical protein